ncbi:lipase family protein [uncultured Tateyamaria sp.]|uniref:lipase family protein n=1 Tax=uncultured Tateyamaria sp. TaxID=455651 RepID=UPI00260F4915|nr:lipase family protein [uncultured Tateyamaria sp.]
MAQQISIPMLGPFLKRELIMLQYFRETATGHSMTNAYLLSVLSFYAYHQPSVVNGKWSDVIRAQVRALSDPDDKAELETVESSGSITSIFDVEVAIVATSRVIFVVFRGSESNPQDWISNINHRMVDVPTHLGGVTNVRVHRGFWASLNSRYPEIFAKVKSRRNNNQKVFLTGHSLGGALATLCAYRFARAEPLPVDGVYTFGAPRVGNHKFRDAYEHHVKGPTFRWVNNKEFAAYLPISDNFGVDEVYYHVGQLNFIEPDQSVTLDRDEQILDAIPSLSVIKDHELQRTCQILRKHLSKKTRESPTDPTHLVYKDPARALSIV